jgi:hypothetical protein
VIIHESALPAQNGAPTPAAPEAPEGTTPAPTAPAEPPSA